MIQITHDIAIAEDEIRTTFIRASGPGGQHVNKASTAVQIRFDAVRSPSLPDDVRRRLFTLAGSRLTDEGEIVITSQRYRSQIRNREDAVEQLISLIREAARPVRRRRQTKPTAGAKRRRLEKKKRRSQIKRLRRKPGMDE
jgi:ribosome-associated protein